jgi:hypothetical protein
LRVTESVIQTGAGKLIHVKTTVSMGFRASEEA